VQPDLAAPHRSENLKALILFEDEHLLVVNKPAGLNTHAPSPFAGEGIYDWLRHREPRWASLAIIHRLDQETSGALVFAKTRLANQSLTEEFTRHSVRKKYVLLTDRKPKRDRFTAVSALARVGERYVCRPLHAGGERAETRFCLLYQAGGRSVVEAEPITGRTHQIRAQAAEHGFPILGDTRYGGAAAPRLFLHAAEITFTHPGTRKAVTFRAPVNAGSGAGAVAVEGRTLSEDWGVEMTRHALANRIALRQALIDPALTNACRLIHGAADGWPGWYVDRFGDFLLSQAERALSAEQTEALAEILTHGLGDDPEGSQAGPGLASASKLRGVYHKTLDLHLRPATTARRSPQFLLGERAPAYFAIRENGIQFELSFNEGYSVGLFLDQRDNRRRVLANHVAAGFPLFADGQAGDSPRPRGGGGPAAPEAARAGGAPMAVLNTFAYTCGFSLCAAAFDLIMLDPPTFSQSKEQGAFQAEKDYGKLAGAALRLLKPGGVLFASTNAAKQTPAEFLETLASAVAGAGRTIVQRHYAPQPPDFPITRAEPAYLKTVWLRIA
jgi:23S rRNA (cytosine1962-C5)-methyltransferase